MAKYRMLASTTWEDEWVASLAIFDRLLWVGMVTVADDQGRLQDNSILLRSKIFPMDPIQIEDVANGVHHIAEIGKIIRYVADGKRIIQIVNWWKHQHHRWAVVSAYPAPPGWTDRIRYNGPGNQVISINWDTEGGYLDAAPAKVVVEEPKMEPVVVLGEMDDITGEYLHACYKKYQVKTLPTMEWDQEAAEMRKYGGVPIDLIRTLEYITRNGEDLKHRNVLSTMSAVIRWRTTGQRTVAYYTMAELEERQIG